MNARKKVLKRCAKWIFSPLSAPFQHYYSWYDVFDRERSKEYRSHLENEYNLIRQQVEKIKGDEIHLSNQSPSCAYYKAPDCHFNSSTAGFAPSTQVKHKSVLLLGIPIITLCSFVFALLIYFALSRMNIQADKFAGLFAAITAICTGIFTLAFSKISKSS